MVVGKVLRSIIFLVSMFAAASAWAVSSSLWEVDSRDDFDAGEPQGVSIVAPGEITLGPRARVTRLDALYVWALVEDSKGNIYAGTGNDGKIFRISREGSEEVFSDLELQQIFALTIDGNDVLYAGGFPGGKVYSIHGQGEVSEYFDTEQNSVWALYIGVNGKLFASTGDEGQIFRIEADGRGNVLYDSPERRILSLLGDTDGNLYAGSEQNGVIYRIDDRGRPFVLYDTELEEVTSMTLDANGNLYAVSSPGELFMKIPPQAAPLVPKTGQDAAAVSQPAAHAQAPMPVPGMPAIPSPKKRTCIIYKIARDGAASKFWVSPEKLIFSIAFDGSNLLAGSGDDGIIYLIPSTGEAGTHYKTDQKQVLELYRSARGAIIAGIGNDAAIVRFDGGYSSKGTFISQVHDATAVSRWGKVFWEADVPRQTGISLATRSGNSEIPDDTWSEWSREYTGADGFTSGSPSARYIQWRAALRTSNPRKTPLLRRVTVAYLQTNLAPEVQSVSAGAGTENQKKGPGADLSEKLKSLASKAVPGSEKQGDGKTKAGKQGVKAAPAAPQVKLNIQWQAHDENGDTLEYELYFKGTEETRWKLLEDELSETSYEWDTEAVPDGEYHVKVIASDSPSNPEESSLTAKRVSEPFMIDNTSPIVRALHAAPARDSGGYRISCTVSDNLSPVRSAEYSIDAGGWVTVFPDDGIFDSLSEKVEFATGRLG
ncbi:MAG: hypothetical protein JSV16_05745, partial [Candidatus Hydrogenedentota bacterium]